MSAEYVHPPTKFFGVLNGIDFTIGKHCLLLGIVTGIRNERVPLIDVATRVPWIVWKNPFSDVFGDWVCFKDERFVTSTGCES